MIEDQNFGIILLQISVECRYHVPDDMKPYYQRPVTPVKVPPSSSGSKQLAGFLNTAALQWCMRPHPQGDMTHQGHVPGALQSGQDPCCKANWRASSFIPGCPSASNSFCRLHIFLLQ